VGECPVIDVNPIGTMRMHRIVRRCPICGSVDVIAFGCGMLGADGADYGCQACGCEWHYEQTPMQQNKPYGTEEA